MHPNSKKFGLYKNYQRVASKMRVANYRTKAWARGSNKVHFPVVEKQLPVKDWGEIKILLSDVIHDIYIAIIKERAKELKRVSCTTDGCNEILYREQPTRAARCFKCKKKMRLESTKEWIEKKKREGTYEDYLDRRLNRYEKDVR